jgi:hypothetical protein
VDVLGADGRAANQPASVTTLIPPWTAANWPRVTPVVSPNELKNWPYQPVGTGAPPGT